MGALPSQKKSIQEIQGRRSYLCVFHTGRVLSQGPLRDLVDNCCQLHSYVLFPVFENCVPFLAVVNMRVKWMARGPTRSGCRRQTQKAGPGRLWVPSRPSWSLLLALLYSRYTSPDLPAWISVSDMGLFGIDSFLRKAKTFVSLRSLICKMKVMMTIILTTVKLPVAETK